MLNFFLDEKAELFITLISREPVWAHLSHTRKGDSGVITSLAIPKLNNYTQNPRI